MPSIKRVVQDARRNLLSFIADFAADVSNPAYQIAMSTFKKTRFTSHIHFLSRCLRHNVVPKGFKLKFHSSVVSRAIAKHLQTCSKNLIRSTLQNYNNSVKSISEDINSASARLRQVCTNSDVYISIRQRIHELNQKIYHCLKDTKDKKFTNLARIDHSITTNTSPPDIVQTIPSDLPFSQEEKMCLAKD